MVQVGFSGRSLPGAAVIAPADCHPLVGLDFLRKFSLALVIDHQRLCLMPNSEMTHILLPQATP